MPEYSIIIADWRRHGAAILTIRRTVFIDEQGVSEALEIDPEDHRHTHALAFDHHGAGIATGRLLADRQIGRMAVLPAWRGRGVGDAILTRLMETARARGVKRVTLSAQVHARWFYAGRGFTAHGGVFMDAGIEHIAMTRELL